MAAALHDAAFLEHQYLVGHTHGREAVRNDDGNPVARQFAKVLKNFGFRAGIDRRGRLVQHQNIGVAAHERARQSNLLPLAARQFAPVLEPLAKLGVISAGKLFHEFRRQALGGGIAPARLIIESADIAGADIFAHQHLIARKVLKYDADALAQSCFIPIREVEPVE